MPFESSTGEECAYHTYDNMCDFGARNKCGGYDYIINLSCSKGTTGALIILGLEPTEAL